MTTLYHASNSPNLEKEISLDRHMYLCRNKKDCYLGDNENLFLYEVTVDSDKLRIIEFRDLEDYRSMVFDETSDGDKVKEFKLSKDGMDFYNATYNVFELPFINDDDAPQELLIPFLADVFVKIRRIK